MAGRIAEYLANNPHLPLTKEVCSLVCECELLHEGRYTDQQLEELETRYIQKYQRKGVLYNEKKIERVRSTSQSSRTSKSRSVNRPINVKEPVLETIHEQSHEQEHE